MRMASSLNSSPPRPNYDADFDEGDSLEGFEEDMGYFEQGSDEDTEDASESEQIKREEQFTEIKEQMYQDKLAQLKKQLQQLKDGTLPEYMKKLKKIDQQYKERIRMNIVWKDYELEIIQKEHISEKKLSAKDFEEKKIDLKESLISELEEKKKHVETEGGTVELTGDSMELKPIVTRKLRRRQNDPMPLPEKRRKPSPAQLNYCLEEGEIMDDLKIINKVGGKPINKRPQQPLPTANSNADHLFDARIDDGRLYYEKKWFHRSQSVYVESKDNGKVPAIITTFGTNEVWLRRTADNSKLKIHVSQLQKGKFTIRKRP